MKWTNEMINAKIVKRIFEWIRELEGKENLDIEDVATLEVLNKLAELHKNLSD